MCAYYKPNYQYSMYNQRGPYGYSDPRNFKRPRHNPNRGRYVFSALTAANAIFASGTPGEENKMLKNIIAPTCSIVLRCGIFSYGLTFHIVNHEAKISKKLEFHISKDALTSIVLTEVPSSQNSLHFVDKTETNSAENSAENTKETKENSAENEKEAENENTKENTKEKAFYKDDKGENKNEEQKQAQSAEEKNVNPVPFKNKQKIYTFRAVLTLKAKPSVSIQNEEVMSTEELENTRIIVLEFKGDIENERLDPKKVLLKATNVGPLKSYATDAVWSPEGVSHYDNVINEFVVESRKVERFMCETQKCDLCSIELERRLMNRHQTKICPQRPDRCGFCEKQLKSCELQAHQATNCPLFVLKCELGCSDGVRRRDVATHAAVCSSAPTNCRFRPVGCPVRPKRGELADHERIGGPQHIGLLLERIRKLEEHCEIPPWQSPIIENENDQNNQNNKNNENDEKKGNFDQNNENLSNFDQNNNKNEEKNEKNDQNNNKIEQNEIKNYENETENYSENDSENETENDTENEENEENETENESKNDENDLKNVKISKNVKMMKKEKNAQNTEENDEEKISQSENYDSEKSEKSIEIVDRESSEKSEKSVEIIEINEKIVEKNEKNEKIETKNEEKNKEKEEKKGNFLKEKGKKVVKRKRKSRKNAVNSQKGQKEQNQKGGQSKKSQGKKGGQKRKHQSDDIVGKSAKIQKQ